MKNILSRYWPKARNEKQIPKMSLNELQIKFNVDISKGLSTKFANEIQALNSAKRVVPPNCLFKKIFHGLTDNFSILLWISIVFYALLYGPLNGGHPDVNNLINIFLISLILLVKTILIVLQDYKSYKLMKSLQSKNMTRVSVLRDSCWTKIPACELVVGDIVEICSNERVPADLRLIVANNLFLDKSILTGEDEPIEASVHNLENIEADYNYLEAKNIALSNFLVVSGYGQGIVISDGIENHFRQIFKLQCTSIKNTNPVIKALNRLAFIVIVMTLLSELIYLIVWFFVLRTKYYSNPVYVWKNILNMAVTGIPIGLPVTVLASLFLLFQKMRKMNIMIKNIFTIKSMNSINVVLTDKTGTLTRSSVKVANVFYSTKEICVDLCYESPEVYLGAQQGLKELIDLCDFCLSDEYSPNSIEKALYDFAKRNRPKSKCLRNEYEIIDEIDFNSNTKYQVRLVKPIKNKLVYPAKEAKDNVLMIRGAPDILLSKCKYMIKPNGEAIKIDQKSFREIENKIDQWSFMGRRLILFCKKNLSEEKSNKDSYNKDFQSLLNMEFNNLVYVGMVGFIDPPKPE